MPKRVLGKKQSLVIRSILFVLAIYNTYTLLLTPYDMYRHMIINLMIILPLSFIIYSSKRNDVSKVPWYDYILAVLSFIPLFILYCNFDEWFYGRLWYLDPVLREQIFLGALLIVLVLESTRRALGIPLMIITLFFILLLFIGPYIPELGIRTKPERAIELMYLTPNGIFATPLQVVTTYIIAFTLLGAVFTACGAGRFFIDLAKATVGKSVGGPAKASVIASSLFGTITGSAVANVYATGVITIPTMKSLGYPPKFAGAVEAVASTGGQIMPPIMGVAAFIMAELLQIPYAKVMIMAVIPALLYYLGVFVQVHYYTLKHGLRGLPKDQIPDLKKILFKWGYYLIPLAVLIYLVAVLMWSPVTAAFISLFITIGLSFIRKETWMTPKKIFESFATGMEEALMIIVAAAAAGMIVGSIAYSGIGPKFGTIVTSLSMGIQPLALALTALLCVILGMGVPTVPAYVITIAVTAPALSLLGVDRIPMHFFVLWFAVLSAITPPIALAAYAAATLAKDNPLKIGLYASRLGIMGFVVPFIIIYRSSILLGYLNPPLTVLLKDIFLSFIATYAIAASLEGYIRRKMLFIERILMFVGSILLFIPSELAIDVLGLVMITLGISLNLKHRMSS